MDDSQLPPSGLAALTYLRTLSRHLGAMELGTVCSSTLAVLLDVEALSQDEADYIVVRVVEFAAG